MELNCIIGTCLDLAPHNDTSGVWVAYLQNLFLCFLLPSLISVFVSLYI